MFLPFLVRSTTSAAYMVLSAILPPKRPLQLLATPPRLKNRMAFRDDAQGILRALSLLKLPPEPSVEEIRKAYFILVKQCHPDKGPVEEKEFRKCRTQDLNNAKDLLIRLAEKRTLKSSDINSHRNKNNSGYSSNATAASRNNTSRGNSQNFNSFPNGASSNFFHKKRKDDTFFHHAQPKKKKRVSTDLLLQNRKPGLPPCTAHGPDGVLSKAKNVSRPGT